MKDGGGVPGPWNHEHPVAWRPDDEPRAPCRVATRRRTTSTPSRGDPTTNHEHPVAWRPDDEPRAPRRVATRRRTQPGPASRDRHEPICVLAQMMRRCRRHDDSSRDRRRQPTTSRRSRPRTNASATRPSAVPWPMPSGCACWRCLSQGERSVSDLSREASCQVPNMSQHLAVLRSAGLVESRREGNTVLYRLRIPGSSRPTS